MSINLIIGPMYAGKSTELVRYHDMFDKDYKGRGEGVLIKMYNDARYDEEMFCTHAGTKRKSLKGIPSQENPSQQFLMPLNSKFDFERVDFIGIDEGQFCADCAEFAEHWAKKGKHIYIAALSGTFQRKAWPVVSELIPLSDSIQHIVALDMKRRPAPFSAKISGSSKVSEVGGKGMYVQATRKQWYKYHKREKKLLSRSKSPSNQDQLNARGVIPIQGKLFYSKGDSERSTSVSSIVTQH